jgi:DNA-binding CsgD family transcriptional regulator/DNA-binding transcriptional ArsR family regulator
VLTESASSRPRHQLVERQRELLELQELFGALRSGQGSLILIGGEIGVGKTALVNEFTRQISSEGIRSFVGHCYDLESTPPYGPWLDSRISRGLELGGIGNAVITRNIPETTPNRRKILEFLLSHGPARPGDVARSLGMTSNAATQHLRRLHATKHVTRPAYGVYEASKELLGKPFLSNEPPESDEFKRSRNGADAGRISDWRANRPSLYYELLDMIVSQVETEPIVLILEDMHWADQASIELLRYIGRNISSTPILIIVTYRDDELSPGQPLYKFLPHIVKESDATRITLRRLSQDAISELLEQRYKLESADLTRLVRHIQRYTDGNAFFVNEVLLTMEQDLQLLDQDGAWHLTDLSKVHIPELVHQFLDGRLGLLSEQDRDLLQVAAVIGIEVPLALLKNVSGVTDDQIFGTIDHAIHAHLLERGPTPSVVRFRHSLVREALAGSMPGLRYQTLHKRVAEAFLEKPVIDPDAVANHLRQANDDRAAEWLIRAGERAVHQFAWIDAVERFQAAVDLIPPIPETSIYRGWLNFHVGMLSRRSNPELSSLVMQTAREIAESSQSELLRGLSTTAMGLISCISGKIRTGLNELEHGVDILETLDREAVENAIRSWYEDEPLSVRLPIPDPVSQRGILIHWLAVAGHYEEAIEMGIEFVIQMPSLDGYSGLYSVDDYYDAFLGLGHAFNMRASPVQAAEALDKVRAGYSTAANLPLAYLQFELMHLIYFKLDQPHERDRVERLVSEIWESHRGMLPIEIPKRFRPPTLLYWYGQWDEVERISRSWASGNVNISARMIGLGLGMLARHRGNSVEAWQWTRRALNPRLDDPPGDCWCELAMQAHRLAADLSLDAGDMIGARRWIELHATYLEKSGAILGRAQHHLLETRYHELQQSDDMALWYARRALEFSMDPHQPLYQQSAHRMLGSLLTREGSHSEAEMHLSASYEIATNCAARFELALTCHQQAMLMMQNGKLAAAHHKHAEALTIASELKAQPLLKELSDLSDLLETRSRRSSYPSGLSQREQEVLQLVAHGMTDAEIADRLFVSPRTVSGHLQSIYSKLSISSRSAATAFAYKHNLV